MLPEPHADPITLGDLDGDGDDDLIMDASSGVQVHRGGPDGLEPAPWFQRDDVSGFLSGATGDVNGDGIADLLISTLELELWLGGPTLVRSPWTAPRGAPAVVDANGDGFGDIAVGENREVALYLGGPDGPDTDPVVVVARDVNNFGDRLWSVGDMDGDGREEVYAPTEHRAFVLMAGGLGEVVVLDVDPQYRAPAAGDFDGDGLGDLAIPQRESVSLWRGSPTGPIFDRALAWNVMSVGALALDGDAFFELVISSMSEPDYGGELSIFPGSPSGPVDEPVFSLVARGFRCRLGAEFRVGDVDGDDIEDFVSRIETEPTSVIVLRGEPGWIP